MLHPQYHWSDRAQASVVERMAKRAALFVDEAPSFQPKGQEVEGGAHAYWGAEVTVPLKLSLRAILKGLPDQGTAANVELVKLVGKESQAELLDPLSLLLPEAEVADPLPTAAVHVESDAEWALIVNYLVNLGIFEPEIPNETIRHKGRPV